MGQIPSPRLVAVIHIQAGARLYVMGHMGHAGYVAHTAHQLMGAMGHAPTGLTARGEGMGQSAPGKGRAGSNGPNIPPRKIAAIHTPMLVSTYIHIYFLKLSLGIVLTHIDH